MLGCKGLSSLLVLRSHRLRVIFTPEPVRPLPEQCRNYSLVLLFALPLNGVLLAPSLKFSCHFPIQPSYLGPLEGIR